MSDSFADLRKSSREREHKPEAVDRKRGGAVPAGVKMVGPVVRGAAAKSEMRAMEKEAAAGRKVQPAKPALSAKRWP
jgi:hypothetical protein